jgi:multiple sugar transport system permease protein
MNSMASMRSRPWIRHVVLILGAIVMVYPLVWMLASSIKPERLIFSDPGIWPSEIDGSNYSRGWNGVGIPFGNFFVNSFIISVGAVIGNLVACSLAAYAFGRLSFPGRKTLFALMLGTMMLPAHATLIPQYILFFNLGWVNTYLPMIAPKFLAVDAFFIFLMVQFIRGLPKELDEAAAIDGASSFEVYWHIILPLLRPALITTALFTFIWTYDDFLTPLIYLSDMTLYTVPQGLRLFLASTGQSSWGPLLAMSVLSLVPVFIIFLIFQNRLIEGISRTGGKG